MTIVSSLDIRSGADLLEFKPRIVTVGGSDYHVLTGYETEPNTCWWCGKAIEQGKRTSHYCRGRSHDDFLSCFRLYHDHFDWAYAAGWARRRASQCCENCGQEGWKSGNSLEVHHIVALIGSERTFSVYNLPFNLVVLCHDCHVGPDGIHAAMRPAKLVQSLTPHEDSWQNAAKLGQSIMAVGI